ncbi:BMP family ABC transporter substrate-binding protein [Lysinibacillus sp. 2017]|uniref:ABC transporter substrate-binding protein n=1 Tax=unclassified Lysinibacillus TaxID=2636778 RepID=UPI000D527B5F|nr:MULTISPECIES: ABC transporter substrate-binding protein [unclassified Lysinibacillus]AWE06235.1 BMP family ABC transporter substrate-binding protein [Lysinibacillus sp. 2017]TGN35289.1 ABC transporter substrate-binding protein [Lysinibacillus sp. S2017]
MKRKLMKLSFLLFGLLLLLTACGGEDDATSSSASTNSDGGEATQTEETKTFKIGTTQIMEHPSLDSAKEGFKKAIEDAGIKAEYVDNSANGDNSANMTIAQQLVSKNVDLIFANSTPSAQAAKGTTTDIPVIFTSVTDAVGAELIDSMASPGGNVTGTIDLHPETMPKTMAFLKELGAKNVGMVYNAGEQNSVAQVSTAKELAAKEGITIVEASASTSAEVKQATESLLGKVDAFYIITDNTVVTALESVIDVANANKLPLIVGEIDSVERGGLAAYGFDYYDIGYEAGQMAAQILIEGKSPSEIPAAFPANLKLVINKAVAENLGIEIKSEWGAEVQ